jgi:hypothetical protein
MLRALRSAARERIRSLVSLSGSAVLSEKEILEFALRPVGIAALLPRVQESPGLLAPALGAVVLLWILESAFVAALASALAAALESDDI